MRRVTGLFGGDPAPPSGGNPESNTLLSEMATVICLDDYHSLDRQGRKREGVTALDPKAQNFDLMYEQVRTFVTTLVCLRSPQLPGQSASAHVIVCSSAVHAPAHLSAEFVGTVYTVISSRSAASASSTGMCIQLNRVKS